LQKKSSFAKKIWLLFIASKKSGFAKGHST